MAVKVLQTTRCHVQKAQSLNACAVYFQTQLGPAMRVCVFACLRACALRYVINISLVAEFCPLRSVRFCITHVRGSVSPTPFSYVLYNPRKRQCQSHAVQLRVV
jgi:hypothetical protein